MDRKYFAELWEKQKKLNTDACRNFWDSRAEEFNQHVHQTGKGNRIQKLIKLFLAQDMINKGSSVLDIGCGPGKYALALSPFVGEITGIDVSSRMLEYAEKNVVEKGAENISFQLLNWEEADIEELGWKKRFDLVMASNCPGVNSVKSLEKMIAASRGYCFISQFVSREDSLKDELARTFARGKRSAHNGTGFYCVFNILWQMGYFPETRYEDAEWEQKMTVEEAMQYYTGFFALTGTLADEEKIILTNKLKEKVSEDGYVRDRVKAKFGWLIWQV